MAQWIFHKIRYKNAALADSSPVSVATITAAVQGNYRLQEYDERFRDGWKS